jgi:hypothetical protein
MKTYRDRLKELDKERLKVLIENQEANLKLVQHDLEILKEVYKGKTETRDNFVWTGKYVSRDGGK